MKHVNPLYRDKQKLKAIATMLGYAQRWYQEADDDRLDVLMWTKDALGNIVNWNPDVCDGDCFKMCLDLNINLTLDKKLRTVSADYRTRNADSWVGFISSPYEENDFMTVVRRVALSAAYELTKTTTHEPKSLLEHTHV